MKLLDQFGLDHSLSVIQIGMKPNRPRLIKVKFNTEKEAALVIKYEQLLLSSSNGSNPKVKRRTTIKLALKDEMET